MSVYRYRAVIPGLIDCTKIALSRISCDLPFDEYFYRAQGNCEVANIIGLSYMIKVHVYLYLKS